MIVVRLTFFAGADVLREQEFDRTAPHVRLYSAGSARGLLLPAVRSLVVDSHTYVTHMYFVMVPPAESLM